MLNVPSAIKALYKRDDIRKNFRVKFPNGEYGDITNSNVVQESVRFTESIGSQDVFRFGLAEASVLEFETVGVGNMYGMTISAFTEIDTSSLTAAQISAIQSDPGDGTLVLEGDSDIGWGFYRIAYGQFQIKSCPRDHKAMTHRKVTAYTIFPSLSAIETAKLYKQNLYNKTYSFKLKNFLYANIEHSMPGSLEKGGYTKSVFANWNQFTDSVISARTVSVYTSSGSISFTINRHSKMCAFWNLEAVPGQQWQYATPREDIFSLELGDYTLDPLYDYLAGKFEQYNVDLSRYPEDNYLDFAKRLFGEIAPMVLYFGTERGATASSMKFDADLKPFTPQRLSTINRYTTAAGNSYQQSGYVRLPSDISILFDGETTPAEFLNNLSHTPTVYVFEDNSSDSNTLKNLRITVNSTLKSKSDNVWYYSFVNAFSFKSLLSGYAELSAQFWQVGRDGSFVLRRLSPSPLSSIQKLYYSSLWWDEYDVDSIGTVLFSYYDASKTENKTDYAFGDGLSVYNMEDNAVINSIGAATKTAIQTLLDELFIPYVQEVTFTPIELDMRSFPWLEAGDAIGVIAEDDTAVNSYIMRREMSGIQNLFDLITAEGGEIMEEDDT